MNALARFLVALLLCLPGLTMATEDGPLWEPIEDKVGWWRLQLPAAVMNIGMKNHGLIFEVKYLCPVGAKQKVGFAEWLGGQDWSELGLDCDGQIATYDVRFHLEPDFFMKLPALPRKQLFETILQPRHFTKE